DFRGEAADQLFLAVQGRQHHTILADLAHDPQPISARLCLYPAGWQQTGGNAALSQFASNHVDRWPVARRELEFRDLGRSARRIPFDQPSLAWPAAERAI